MKKFVLSIVCLLMVSACMPVRNEALIGGGAGAAIGAVASPGNPIGGAVIGGVIGGLAGQLIGESKRSGYCMYRDRDGSYYERLCPAHGSVIGEIANRPGYCTYINRRGKTYQARCPQ